MLMGAEVPISQLAIANNYDGNGSKRKKTYTYLYSHA